MSAPRRILYLAPSAGIGGAETFVQQTALFHNKNYYEPYYALLREGPLHGWLKAQTPNTTELSPVHARLSRPHTVIKTISWLRDLIRRHDISIVHSTMGYGALFGAPAARAEKVHHVWYQHGPASGWMDFIAGILPSRLMLVNSVYTKHAQLRIESPGRFLISKTRKIERFVPSVDLQSLPKVDEKKRFETRHLLGLSENEVGAAIFCRLDRWKGIHVFLDAIAMANAQYPKRPIRGFVFGPFDPKSSDISYLKELASQNQSTGNQTKIMGRVEDPFLVMQALDILVNSSVIPEPFGLTIVEGMACGMVPLVPNEGGPREIVDHEKTGLLFTPRESESLAQALVQIASDVELQKRLSAQARLEVAQNYDIAKSISGLEDIYDSIL